MMRAMSFVRHLLFFFATTVSAFPDGTPNCEVGASSTRSLHLIAARNPQTGQIQKGGFDVFINDKLLEVTVTGPNVFDFDVGVDNKLTIKSNTGKQLKGVLIILSKEGSNTTLNLTPLPPYQPSLKSTADGILRWDTLGDELLLDVNIVVQNNATGSVYYYTNYKLRAAAPVEESCGLLGLSIFCPLSFCGVFGRLLGLCGN